MTLVIWLTTSAAQYKNRDADKPASLFHKTKRMFAAAQMCKNVRISLADAPARPLRHRSETPCCGFRAKKNLPNIVGKSDIFGRTTPTGVETVQYMGVRDGRVHPEGGLPALYVHTNMPAPDHQVPQLSLFVERL
jgi:hypothetical protein